MTNYQTTKTLGAQIACGFAAGDLIDIPIGAIVSVDETHDEIDAMEAERDSRGEAWPNNVLFSHGKVMCSATVDTFRESTMLVVATVPSEYGGLVLLAAHGDSRYELQGAGQSLTFTSGVAAYDAICNLVPMHHLQREVCEVLSRHQDHVVVRLTRKLEELRRLRATL